MTSAETVSEVTAGRPLRADAQRNYEKLLAAGRDAFTEEGSSASLEEIARRAGVGIGTLYRHFPTRQALLEAVYVEEMDALCRSADDLRDTAPWDALVAWLHRFVDYVATKEALAHELFAYVDRDADVFRRCHDMFYAAGEPLLERAQQAHLVRPDTNITDVVRMVVAIAKMPSGTPEQIERVVDMALDGLRFNASV
ncbi:MAG TPA: helix-turn-helix domain-containing protein [Acidimicrobiales bacterium]|nr:helix-turn-helix domain-containing protein [Acidimicrobiales bacterium]